MRSALLLLLTSLVGLPSNARAEIVNVAPQGVASLTGTLWGGGNIARLIDGDPSTFIHGDTAPAVPFVYGVDLGKDYAIQRLRLLPRQDGCCADRLRQFRLSVHSDNGQGAPGTEVWGADLFTDGSNAGSGAGVVVEIPLPAPANARHVQILSLADPIPDYALQIAELEVLADVPASEVNRALKTLATSNRPLYASANPALLVDGSHASFVHGTEVIERPFHYTINLGTRVKLSRIVVWARQDGCCPERLTHYRVSVHPDASGAPGAAAWSATLHADGSNPGSEAGAKDILTASLDPAGTFEGQWIRLESLEDPISPYALQIGEVQAFGEPLGGASLLLTSQPANTSAGVGQTASFTVGATVVNGDPTRIGYQWERAGAPIADATNATYTTPPVLTTDDKATYRCVVSYPGLASQTSEAATLRVNLAYQSKATSNRPLWGPGGWSMSVITDGNRGNVLHGDTAIEPGMAYELDLGASIKFEEIDIFPRQDGCCGERLANIRVSVLQDAGGTAGAEVWKTDLFTDGSNAGSGPGVVVRITGNQDPAGTFEGQWLRILALDDPVPDYFLQIAEVEAYGAFSSGVPKLEITTPPTDAPSAPGRTATFSLAAKVVNGDPARIGYQWFRDGQPIAGAVTNIFTTPPLVDADTNAVFRCVITYPGIADLPTGDVRVFFDYNYARGQAAFSNRPLWGPGNWNISMIVDGNRANTLHGDTAIVPGFAYDVNLGVEVDVQAIDIYPRQDGCCAERLANFQLSVHADAAGALGEQRWSATLFTDGSNAGSGPGVVVHVTPDQGTGEPRGQWVRLLALDDPVPDYFLQLTEIEVFGRARIVAAPTLSANRVASSLVITWNAAGFLLQESTALGSGASWSNVPGGSSSPVTVPFAAEGRFYRLRSQ